MSQHEVPTWRPGVVAWKPTSDGREIGVYPQLWGNGMLYRGPLADEFGHDETWWYETVNDAVRALEEWDGESAYPPGNWNPTRSTMPK